MHVIANGLEIAIATTLDQQAFVTPGKDVAELFVPVVESVGVNGQKPTHALHQVSSGSFDNQVKVIVHQAPGVNLPIGFLARLAQRQ